MATIKMVIQLRRATTAEWLDHKDVVPAQGEPCYDYELNTLKIGDGVKTYEQLEPIGSTKTVSVSADGTSIVLEDSVFKLAGFDAAAVGAQPRKNADGKLEWYVPTTTVEELQASVTELQTSVTEIREIVMPSGEDSVPLLTRLESLETKMDGTGEGTVDAKIDAKIEAFATGLTDDGKVNTLMELINYVEAHGEEAAELAGEIADLRALVGTTSVQDQIDVAVSGKVDAEEGKSLVADTLISKLEAIEAGAQVNKIEEIYVGEMLLDIVDKKVVIPVGAGLKTSEEITVSEDGTLGIGTISFSKIVQEESETVIMDGGGAAG